MATFFNHRAAQIYTYEAIEALESMCAARLTERLAAGEADCERTRRAIALRVCAELETICGVFFDLLTVHGCTFGGENLGPEFRATLGNRRGMHLD